jgi:hypothetical protein
VDSRPAEGDAARLIVAGGVEGQLRIREPSSARMRNVLVGDQEVDGFAAVSPADADVVEAAEVAEGDLAGLVDAVVADPEVSLGSGPDGVSLEAGVEGDQGRPAVEGPVGPAEVVEGAEGVELDWSSASEWAGAWWARKRLRVWWKRSTLPQVWGW